MNCKLCGHPRALHYYAKVGGGDELVEQCHCADIDACMKRQLKNKEVTMNEEVKERIARGMAGIEPDVVLKVQVDIGGKRLTLTSQQSGIMVVEDGVPQDMKPAMESAMRLLEMAWTGVSI